MIRTYYEPPVHKQTLLRVALCKRREIQYLLVRVTVITQFGVDTAANHHLGKWEALIDSLHLIFQYKSLFNYTDSHSLIITQT